MASGHAPDLANAPDERPQNPKKRRITSTPGPLQSLQGGSLGTRQRSDSSSVSAAMDRSTTPPEAADGVRRTKTGRVSKAIKGQRVHHCEECGKTYTRAEHLRRHSTNHKPGAFRCDHPGCPRAFHRDDLLARHRARHDELSRASSRRVSLAVPDSPQVGNAIAPLPSHINSLGMTTTIPEPSASRSPAPVELRPSTTRPPNEQPVVGNRPPRKQYASGQDFRAQAQPVSVDQMNSRYLTYDYTAQPSPQDSSDEGGSQSFSHLPYMPQVQPGFNNYQPPGSSDFHASRSSISTNASGLPYWGLGAQSPAFGYSTPSSDLSYTNLPNACNNLSLYPQLAQQAIFDPILRDNMEASKLVTPSATAFGLEGFAMDLGSWSNEERYLDAYWQNVHPVWPVVLETSFDPLTTSPLLRAALVALGAQSIGLREDFANARIVHERCLKAIKQRAIEVSHSYRTCDMQAILLVEVFAIFKSRRPPLQLSKPFEDVVALLVADHLATQAAGSSLINSSSQAFGAGEIGSRPRILSACYILDRQHAVFFGRRKTPRLDQVARSLAVPHPHLVWDMMGGSGPTGLSGSTLDQIVGSTANLRAGNSIGRDIYQCRLPIAYLSDLGDQGVDSVACEDYAHGIESVLEFSARAALLYHTTMLCQHAHIRDLLAVAGESWVMAEKMSSQAEYTVSQIDTRQWAMDAAHSSSPVRSALTHALEILRIHQANPRTGLLFQEWAIYLASVVIWARAYVSDESSRRLRLSIPSPTEPRGSAQELEHAVTTVISNGSAATITWQQAKSVLLWVQGKIEDLDLPANTCGLTNGALDVLGKLVTRGNEEGHWF